MKIFQTSDCAWYAAETAEEAKAQCIVETGLDESEIDAPKELSDEDMDKMVFFDEPDQPSIARSFRQQLDLMIARGDKFPCLFATLDF